MEPDSIFLLGSLASLGAGLATGAGALPAFFFKSVSRRTLDAMLGWAAGVMLAATSFSLLIPAIDAGDHLWGSKGILAVLAGLVVGALFLDRADKWLPHEHVLLGPEGPASRMRKVWLFIIAVTIHNFPEGMAVGVGYGSGDVGGATALAIGIGIQNMPEGLAVALPLMGEGKSRWFAVIVATLTGLVEPVGGILGAGAGLSANAAMGRFSGNPAAGNPPLFCQRRLAHGPGQQPVASRPPPGGTRIPGPRRKPSAGHGTAGSLLPLA